MVNEELLYTSISASLSPWLVVPQTYLPTPRALPPPQARTYLPTSTLAGEVVLSTLKKYETLQFAQLSTILNSQDVFRSAKNTTKTPQAATSDSFWGVFCGAGGSS